MAVLGAGVGRMGTVQRGPRSSLRKTKSVLEAEGGGCCSTGRLCLVPLHWAPRMARGSLGYVFYHNNTSLKSDIQKSGEFRES